MRITARTLQDAELLTVQDSASVWRVRDAVYTSAFYHNGNCWLTEVSAHRGVTTERPFYSRKDANHRVLVPHGVLIGIAARGGGPSPHPVEGQAEAQRCKVPCYTWSRDSEVPEATICISLPLKAASCQDLFNSSVQVSKQGLTFPFNSGHVYMYILNVNLLLV